MPIIKKLDEQLINMIAAGEVVERPAAIVKELVENSIDANANDIIIKIKAGGIESIEVIDNGCGMDAIDALNAFTRHATSKISQTNDLFKITTNGFRGEAIPSIASVSKFNLLTNNGQESNNIIYEYGNMISNKPASSNQGTTVNVTGLFIKTPARLKYLKSASYEASLISDLVFKFSLSRPTIAFTLYSDDREVYSSSGNNNLKDIIFNAYGKQVAKDSFYIEGNDDDFKVSGIAVLPQHNRSTKHYINIFINNRVIRYYRLIDTLADTYKDYLAKSRYPIIALNITVDEKLTDVNVHPGKWTIKLSKEAELIKLIKDIFNTILIKELRPINIPVAAPSYTDFTYDFTKNDSDNSYQASLFMTDDKNTNNINIDEIANLEVLCQADQKYIIATNKTGLYIFDQHATHERINYEYYHDNFLIDHGQQQLLIPLNIKLNTKIINKIDNFINDVKQFNINVELFGHDEIIIREIPVWMKDLSHATFINDLIDYYQDKDSLNVDDLTKKKIATIACHSSVRFNQALSNSEMKQALIDLSKCSDPYHCPHGRPTFNKLEYKDLERYFNR